VSLLAAVCPRSSVLNVFEPRLPIMDSIVRAAVVYAFLLVVFRVSGKRSLAKITTFDFVLTLVISECVQQSLLGADDSMTNGFLLVLTLVAIDVGFSFMKQKSKTVRHLVDGAPLLIVERGSPHKDRMDKERVDEDDVLSAAREKQGLTALDDVDYAVLEENGEISIVPKRR
jgi:uncharacterized membrane protein YcaP (DUF421 family)